MKPLTEKAIVIRQATMRDLPKLKPLWLEFMSYHESFGDKYRFFPQEWPAVLKRFIKTLHRDQAVIFVAEDRGNLIGYTFGFIFVNHPGYFPKEVGFVNDFIISEKYRHIGFGLKLYTAMESWFKDRGVQIVQLYVSTPNKAGKDFWVKCGFEHYLEGLWKEIG